MVREYIIFKKEKWPIDICNLFNIKICLRFLFLFIFFYDV